MPAAYFHEAVARKAFERIGGAPQPEAVWILGAQGPDPLFFYRALRLRHDKAVNRMGDTLHSMHTGRFLCQLVRLAKTESPAAQSYALGFISHYACDTALHPFVYAHSFTRKGRYKGMRHLCLEAQMDSWAWREAGGQATPLHYGQFPDKPQLEQAAALLSAALARVFPAKPVSPSAIEQAFCDAKAICRLLYSPHGVKFSLFWLLERVICFPCLVTGLIPPRWLPRKDFLNIARRRWASPWEPERIRHESAPELMEQAVDHATRWMALARGYWAGESTLSDLAAALGDMHYSSGLPWRATRPIA